LVNKIKTPNAICVGRFLTEYMLSDHIIKLDTLRPTSSQRPLLLLQLLAKKLI